MEFTVLRGNTARNFCDPIVPYVQDLDNIVIKDKIYKIPKDPYLIKLYGKYWKTPLKRDKGVANGL